MCFDGTLYDPNPKDMKPKDLRKFCAQNGLSPMGSKDELILRVRDHVGLKSSADEDPPADSASSSSSLSSSSSASTGSSSSSSSKDPKVLMASIIDLGALMNYEAILSLSGTDITKDTATSGMRKAYLRISMKVHPDKNGQSSDSKNAFQFLVNAYERLSQPELYLDEEVDNGKPKHKKIGRGNHGCYITRVDCPRCKMEWNKAELGLEKGAYNWFMNGIKLFACGRCLMDFGCMTGIHRCP